MRYAADLARAQKMIVDGGWRMGSSADEEVEACFGGFLDWVLCAFFFLFFFWGSGSVWSFALLGGGGREEGEGVVAAVPGTRKSPPSTSLMSFRYWGWLGSPPCFVLPCLRALS